MRPDLFGLKLRVKSSLMGLGVFLSFDERKVRFVVGPVILEVGVWVW